MRAPTKFFLVAAFSISTLWGASGHPQTVNPPTINFSYAQEKIRQGEIWKIYLSVSDPDGKMSRIVFTIDQDGALRYKPSILYLKKGMEKLFAGYFTLYTNSSANLWGEEINLKLSILDRAGNELKTLSFPLEFDGESAKPLPPEMEKELNRRIGTIDFDLDTAD